MRTTRWILALALIAGCGSGANEEDLAAAVAPLVDAHDALEDWQFRVEAGLSYGDILSEWPDVSADVRSDLDLEALELGEDDSCDAVAYLTAIAAVHDQWSEVREAVRSFIQDEGSESLIASEYAQVDRMIDEMETTKPYALTPGPDADTCIEES